MDKKIKILFVFGAGASMDAGAPLMNDFIDKARKVLSLKSSFHDIDNYKKDFDDVFNLIARLQGVHSKSFLDLDNIETLFGAIEMGSIFEKLGEADLNEIKRLKASIIRVIVKTLEYTLPFNVTKSQSRYDINPTLSYWNFIAMLTDIYAKQLYKFSIITFNYDLLLEVALSRTQLKYDYCLEGKKSNEVIPLLKLHGSINWSTNKKDQNIQAIDVSKVRFNLMDTGNVYYNIGSNIISGAYDYLDNIPIIVPPTWNKTEYHKQLKNVWKSASEELSESEIIFIIGYSLPETDLFFRYLYSLGTLSKTALQQVVVINPDPGVRQKYEEMIGRGILIRRFNYFPFKFSDSIDTIKKILKEVVTI